MPALRTRAVISRALSPRPSLATQVSMACSDAHRNRNSCKLSTPSRRRASTTPSSNEKLSPNFVRISSGEPFSNGTLSVSMA
jgi:hypothetical protein